jgi:hypothetical protein
MSVFQTEKLTKYIIEKIIKDNLAKNVISSDNNISELKSRLTTEIEARLCVIPEEGMTFDYLVSAMINQVELTNYINN